MTDTLDLDLPAPKPSGRRPCPHCEQEYRLWGEVLPPHPTVCRCRLGHPPGVVCPFVTTCAGSLREPAGDNC